MTKPFLEHHRGTARITVLIEYLDGPNAKGSCKVSYTLPYPEDYFLHVTELGGTIECGMAPVLNLSEVMSEAMSEVYQKIVPAKEGANEGDRSDDEGDRS